METVLDHTQIPPQDRKIEYFRDRIRATEIKVNVLQEHIASPVSPPLEICPHGRYLLTFSDHQRENLARTCNARFAEEDVNQMVRLEDIACFFVHYGSLCFRVDVQEQMETLRYPSDKRSDDRWVRFYKSLPPEVDDYRPFSINDDNLPFCKKFCTPAAINTALQPVSRETQRSEEPNGLDINKEMEEALDLLDPK